MSAGNYEDIYDESSIADIYGQKLFYAKELLQSKGIVIKDIYITAPPRESNRDFNDNSRVIKVIKIRDNVVDLLVCNPSL